MSDYTVIWKEMWREKRRQSENSVWGPTRERERKRGRGEKESGSERERKINKVNRISC